MGYEKTHYCDSPAGQYPGDKPSAKSRRETVLLWERLLLVYKLDFYGVKNCTVRRVMSYIGDTNWQ